MAQANDAQVQQYANERMRVRAEQIRALLNALVDDRGAIDEVYERIVNGAAWRDARTDGPPKLLTGNDLLAYNTLAYDLIAYLHAHPQWPVVRAACVQPVR